MPCQSSGQCTTSVNVDGSKTYPSTIRKRTDPTPFSPRDSQGSCQSAEQGDYKRSIHLYALVTKTLTIIILENN
jgi:hypothetical protein